jgi:diguanylate cyclase (GGDEF)-like protein/PAS domain S-box-containing protein
MQKLTIGKDAPPRQGSRSVAGIMRLVAQTGRHSPGSASIATGVCLAMVLAISAFVGETGRLAYSNLNYPVVIYAGLALPWPAALAVTLCAMTGPNPHGSVFLDAFDADRNAVIRPITIAIVSAIAVGLGRASRASEDTLRAGEQRLFSFLESVPIGVFVFAAGGAPYYANQAAQRLLGRELARDASPDQLVSLYRAFVAGTSEPYPLARTPMARALAGETSVVDDMEVERDDGRINLQVWGAPIRDASGNVTHAVAAFSNITAQKRWEAALRESEARFRAVFEEGPLGMAIVSADNHFSQVNEALCAMTGYRGDELAGMTFTDLTHPDDRELHQEETERLHSGKLDLLDIEKRYVRKDGAPVWVRVCVRVVRDSAGRREYSLVMVQDVTDRRKALAEVERLAYHDALTGLPNRRLMYDRLGQAIARARRFRAPVAVLSIDLDGFKKVNDEHGHAAGDAVLVEAGKRLAAAVRDTDTVARMGGDEFLVLVPDAPGADLDIVCRRIEEAFLTPAIVAGERLSVRASLGRATLFEDGDDEDSLISAADAAMYRNKEAARRAPAR